MSGRIAATSRIRHGGGSQCHHDGCRLARRPSVHPARPGASSETPAPVPRGAHRQPAPAAGAPGSPAGGGGGPAVPGGASDGGGRAHPGRGAPAGRGGARRHHRRRVPARHLLRSLRRGGERVHRDGRRDELSRDRRRGAALPGGRRDRTARAPPRHRHRRVPSRPPLTRRTPKVTLPSPSSQHFLRWRPGRLRARVSRPRRVLRRRRRDLPGRARRAGRARRHVRPARRRAARAPVRSALTAERSRPRATIPPRCSTGTSTW